MTLQEILKRLLIIKLQLEKALLKRKLTIPNLPQPRYIFIHHGAGSWGFAQVNRHHKTKWGFKSS